MPDRESATRTWVARRQHFDAFDEFEAAVADWELDFVQLDRGALAAEHFSLGGLDGQITRVALSRRFRQRGAAPRGMRTFGVLTQRAPSIAWCGRDFGPGMIAAFGPERDFESVSPPGFAVYTLSFPEERLARIATDLGIRNAEEILVNDHTLHRCDGPELRRLHMLLREIERAAHRASGPATPRIDAALSREVPVALLLAFGEARDRPRRARDTRAATVRRALERLERSTDEPVPIDALARAVDVSERTLRYAFQEQLGVGPKAYQQAFRLDKVRRALRDASPDDVTVGRIAARWGFRHAGQFATDYRQHFGELPSRTLARRPPRTGNGVVRPLDSRLAT